MSMNLVKAVCPDFPIDREVLETSNFEKFWKIINGKLNVPNDKIVKGNFVLLDKYIEAVNAFAHMNIHSDNYDWQNLNTCEVEKNKAIEAIKFLEQYDKLAVDIETKRIEYEDNKILLIGFAYNYSDSLVFRYNQLTVEEIQKLQGLFNKKEIKFIWHNGKFDITRLKYLANIDARVDEDTMLQHYVGINERKGTHGLKDLGPLYLQAPQWDDELQEYKKTWCRNNKVKVADFTYDMIPADVLIPYLHRDCIATFRLNQVFDKLMRDESRWLYRKLCEAANVYAQIELNGNYLDKQYMYELEDILDNEIVEAEREVRKIAKQYWDVVKYSKDTGAKSFEGTFNLKSPKQLKWILEEITGTKINSTDKEALDQLAEEFPEIAFIQAIVTLRKANKYMDTYVQGIRDVICKDGRVRCSFNLHGTETGRLSCSEPNMQNIPRNKLIKNLFIAPPEMRLVQFDYSQAELRVLAWLCQDEYLKNTYKEGKDLHDAMALKIFGENFTKEDRVAAKTVNFGIPYGRGPGTISKALKMSFGTAHKLIQDWYKAAPGAKQFVDKMRSLPLQKNVEPYTTIFGRQRHYILTNDNLNTIQNESINFPIQATASDCTVLSVCEIYNKIKELGLENKVKIVNNVHDSIILEVEDNDELVKQIVKIGKEIMENVPKKYLVGLDFPFRADVETGYKWGELHE